MAVQIFIQVSFGNTGNADASAPSYTHVALSYPYHTTNIRKCELHATKNYNIDAQLVDCLRHGIDSRYADMLLQCYRGDAALLLGVPATLYLQLSTARFYTARRARAVRVAKDIG